MAVPVIAAQKLGEVGKRFWSSLVEASGKPAVVTTRTRQVKKPFKRSSHVHAFGWERTRAGTTETETIRVDRWEIAAGLLVGGGYLAKKAGLTVPWPPNLGGGGLADWLNPLTSPLSGLGLAIGGAKAIASAAQSSGVVTGVQSSSNVGYNRSVFSAITGKTYDPTTGTWK
jgi:hypothetical protein